jgi:hypothetical protein
LIDLRFAFYFSAGEERRGESGFIVSTVDVLNCHVTTHDSFENHRQSATKFGNSIHVVLYLYIHIIKRKKLEKINKLRAFIYPLNILETIHNYNVTYIEL